MLPGSTRLGIEWFTDGHRMAASMEARRVGASFRIGGDARQRLYRARGIGRPVGEDEIELTWVEAAYLLERGDLDAIDGLDARAFLGDVSAVGDLARLCAYRDLRERGYYVSSAYRPGTTPDPTDVVFRVRPRGAEPTTDEVAHRVVVVGESTDVVIDALPEATLAIVDDESEVTYAEIHAIEPEGEQAELPGVTVVGTLNGDRVLVGDPPVELHHGSLFGRPVEEDGATLWLNLLEARYLERRGILELDADAGLVERGRELEGHAFDRRERVYRALRRAGAVPRSGLKFGADFRVYTSAVSADDPGHSSMLVEVTGAGRHFTPRELARGVRLANGVRKRHVLAVVDDGSIEWRAVERLRP